MRSSRSFIFKFLVIVILCGLPSDIKSGEAEQFTTDKTEKLVVAWEGSFLDLGSLSNVNHSITEELRKVPQIDLACVNTNIIRQSLLKGPELRKILPRIRRRSPEDVAVTVRHAWPPNWTPPARGKWVLMQPWEFGSLPEEWVDKIKQVDEVWVPTHFVKKEYTTSGVPAEKVKVIPNGYDPSIFHPDIKPFLLPTNKKFKFLFVGGTIYRKGPDLLLGGYQKAFKAKDDVCLVVKDFGNKSCYAGQTHKEIFKAAQQVPGGAEIVYLDQEMTAEEIASLYKACDCLVYPYRGEGFALPVLEAMACGLPVVVTDGGATDDFVTNACGWFIPSHIESIDFDLDTIKLVKEGWLLKPDVDVLAALLSWLSKHPLEVQVKGIVASKKAKDWTWEKSAARAAERLRCLAQEN